VTDVLCKPTFVRGRRRPYAGMRIIEPAVDCGDQTVSPGRHRPQYLRAGLFGCARLQSLPPPISWALRTSLFLPGPWQMAHLSLMVTPMFAWVVANEAPPVFTI